MKHSNLRQEMHDLTNDQLNDRIRLCGTQLQAAHKLGMKCEAMRWLDQQNAALRERQERPEMVEAMEVDYFGAMGEMDRARLAAKRIN